MKLNSYKVWLSFCALFLLGLVDWRRPLTLRNLDLLVLVSLSVSLELFNRGHIFAAMSAAYPPLAWLLVRCFWIGRRDRPSPGAAIWPVWLLIAATVFLAGFRVGLNVRTSDVIDVGYSGVIGADRIWHGQSPYGHFPIEGNRPEVRAGRLGWARCVTGSRRTAAARARTRSGTPTGRSRTSPTCPATGSSAGAASGIRCRRCTSTALLFDALALLGLGLVGRRLGGPRLGATLAFAWVAWPFTQYASNSNTNDSIMPAFLIWGFLALTSPAVRGVSVALSGWTKFASLLVVPLWSGYPEARRGAMRPASCCGSRSRRRSSSSSLFLEPSPLHAARVFVDRTVRFQVGRDSPFSIWDWGQYHARGIPEPEDRSVLPAGAARARRARARHLAAQALGAAAWPRSRPCC